ncbi:hypothetical protein ASPVEDRAFT_42880 [Aspergillus versicolor CBS 583.65]|uniref:Mid2 domain-containing protein n=1 Tax=Aspergillus versicolor CBS 583.65 TaxID=1036611 RepID=A0A1L9PPK3_ASPVE|nr:uncharacterized protein ASPVEDRAFT_42880 [Aspergillus versicolor CBS 583.65]OJJ03365.1 hypothetical protein ASPVEDRAFT_42880 [Aspergillus versicolor CBS 583.65]
MATMTWVWLLLLSVLQVVRSDETARGNWIVPDGSSDKDFQETFYNRDKVHLQWAGWDHYYTDILLNGSTQANLYVVAWEEKDANYSRLLASSRNVSGPGSHEWAISIDNETLAKTNRYCVAFAQTRYAYSDDGDNIFSPGFIIRNRPTPSPTPSPEAESSPSGLQTGAKVGIGVGVGVGSLAVFSAFGFLLLQLRRRRQASSQAMAASPQGAGPGSEQALGKGYYQGQMWNRDYYYGVNQGPPELDVPPVDSLTEAPSTSTPPAELPTAPLEK